MTGVIDIQKCYEYIIARWAIIKHFQEGPIQKPDLVCAWYCSRAAVAGTTVRGSICCIHQTRLVHSLYKCIEDGCMRQHISGGCAAALSFLSSSCRSRDRCGAGDVRHALRRGGLGCAARVRRGGHGRGRGAGGDVRVRRADLVRWLLAFACISSGACVVAGSPAGKQRWALLLWNERG